MAAPGRNRLNNRDFGVLVKEMHLAHIKNQIHLLIDRRTVMGADPGNKGVFPGIQVEIDL